MTDAARHRMTGIGMSLLISIALIVVLWLVGPAVGFQISLLGSVALTIVLTLVVNLVLGAMRSRRARHP